MAADQPRVTKFKINWDSLNAAQTAETNGETAQAENMNSNANANDAEMGDENNFQKESTATSAANNIANSFDNKENMVQQQKSVDGKFLMPDLIINNNTNQLFENSVDSMMN
jgi:hypothetical protein